MIAALASIVSLLSSGIYSREGYTCLFNAIDEPQPNSNYPMKTQVEFRSSKFPPYQLEQEQINPGIWGQRLAEYLVRELNEKGITTDDIIAED